MDAAIETEDKVLALLKKCDAYSFHDFALIRKPATEALNLARQAGDQNQIATCYLYLAYANASTSGLDESAFESSTANWIFDHQTAKPELAAHYFLARVRFDKLRTGMQHIRKSHSQSVVDSVEAIPQEREFERFWAEMMVIHEFGVLGQNPKKEAACTSFLENARQYAQHNEIMDVEAMWHLIQARQSLRRDPSDNTTATLRRVIKISRRCQNRLIEFWAESTLGIHWQGMGLQNQALNMFRQAAAVAGLTQSQAIRLSAEAQLAAAEFQMGNLSEAEVLVQDIAQKNKFFLAGPETSKHRIWNLAKKIAVERDDHEQIEQLNQKLAPHQTEKEIDRVQADRNTALAMKDRAEHELREFRNIHENVTDQLITEKQAALNASNDWKLKFVMAVAACLFILMVGFWYVGLARLRRAKRMYSALERKVSRLERMESLGLMAGGVAHDFNNLLVGMICNAEMLDVKTGENEPFVKERVKQILHSAEKAAELSRQMLAYAGKQPIARKVVDLNQLIQKLKPLLGSVDSRKQIHTKLDHRPLVVEVDEMQIQQVIMNLVANARNACPDETMISIRTGRESIKKPDHDGRLFGDRHSGGSFAYLEVTDNGSGISPEELDHIFEPFYSRTKGGRGLGLAVVYGIVNGHEGLLKVSSRIGRGTTIRVYLPLCESEDGKDVFEVHPALPASQQLPDPHLSPTASAESATRQKKLLVVDDEAAVNDATTQIFRIQGWQVISANNGLDAIQKMEDHSFDFDCALIDIVMPHMDGEELLRWMNDNQAGIPIILMSGYNESSLERYGDDNTVVAVVQKPFRLQQIVQLVESQVGRATGQRGSVETKP